MVFNPQNILVIDFGQLGDVVMSLPALRAIRERFPNAKITVAVGKSGGEIVDMAGYADETLKVDRVALRDGFTPMSVWTILKIVKDVRRRRFDFVIDLHSFYETNLLGFVSGARQRLFARRPGRSIDFLGNFRPAPAVDKNDPGHHLVDRYLDAIAPLQIGKAEREPRLSVRPEDDRAVTQLLRKASAQARAHLVGLYPGAGNESRRWPLENFAQLADLLTRTDAVRPIVFTGPEERRLIPEIRSIFPSHTVVFDQLSIQQLAAALARLAVFVSNDTGPLHIAAAVGAPIVLLLHDRAPATYIPLSEPKRVIYGAAISEIPVEQVYEATRALLAAGRETLFDG